MRLIASNIRISYLFILCVLVIESVFTEDTKLIAGYDIAKPFHYLENGKLIGIDIEILESVIDKTGYTIEYIELPWARTLLNVEKGQVDIAIGAGFNESRTQWGYYSLPYKHINHWLYTKKEHFDHITSIDDFLNSGLILGIIIGWGYPIEIKLEISKELYKDQLVKGKNIEQLLKLLELGRIDGLIAIPEMLDQPLVPRAKYKEDLYFIFSKSSVKPDYVAEFNNALLILINSGKRNEIMTKY